MQVNRVQSVMGLCGLRIHWQYNHTGNGQQKLRGPSKHSGGWGPYCPRMVVWPGTESKWRGLMHAAPMVIRIGFPWWYTPWLKDGQGPGCTSWWIPVKCTVQAQANWETFPLEVQQSQATFGWCHRQAESRWGRAVPHPVTWRSLGRRDWEAARC